MQLNIDFTINKLAYLQQDLRKAEEKLNKALLSIRAYKGHKTKRCLKPVNKIKNK